MMERFARIAEGLDVSPLLKRILANEDLWGLRTERQSVPGSPHRETEAIFLRWAVDESVEGGFYCLKSRDHLETIYRLAPEIFPLCQIVIGKILGKPHDFNDDIGRAMLTRMQPGGVIPTHVDEGPYADRYDRFHVCLSGMSNFLVEGVEQVMVPGELWWFNHKLEHGVRYSSMAVGPRIHLILDVVAPAYRAKRGLTFQRERAVDLWDEAMPLFERHYRDVAHYQDITLKINQEHYNQADALGVLRCYTARMNGDLIGYCVFFVRHNMRYFDSLQALQDVLFLLPEYRGKSAGVRLIKFCEDRLRQEGCQVVYQHTKAASNVGKLLERLGYEHIDNVYGKRLDKEA